MTTAGTPDLYKESDEGAHRKTALFIVIIVLLTAAVRMPLPGGSHIITGTGKDLPQLPPGHRNACALLMRKGRL